MNTLSARLALVISLFAAAVGLPGQAADAIRIAVDRDAGEIVLRWSPQAGYHYYLESSADLEDWQVEVADFVDAGAEMAVSLEGLLSGTLDEASFWRISGIPNTGVDTTTIITPLRNAHASVVPQIGVNYNWAITGGEFTESNGAADIHFMADTTGTVVLTCTLTDQGTGAVVAEYSATLLVGGHPLEPEILAPAFVDAGDTGLVASVEPQAGAVYLWSIMGGEITGGQGTRAIEFTAGAAGVLHLSCAVTRGGRTAPVATASVQVLAGGAALWETPLSESSLPSAQINVTGGGLNWTFANMLRTAEAWVFRDGVSAAEASELARTIEVGPDGAPLNLPDGYRLRMEASYITSSDPATGETTYLHGVYVLTWDGSGEVDLETTRNDGLDEEMLLNDQEGGRLVMVVRDPTKGIMAMVYSSDPADPVRNMRLWAPVTDGAGIDLTPSSDLAPGHIAGSLEPAPGEPEPMWHPRFLEHLREAPNYGALRFMGWQQINLTNWDRDTLDWSDRASPDYSFGALNALDGSYNRYPVQDYRVAIGQPFEWMIDLCNEVHKDLWIQLPHIASPDLIRGLAGLCAERLDPDLRVWFELSNEIWNGYGPYVPQMNAARLAAAQRFGVPFASVSWEQHAWGSGHLQGRALKIFEDEWRARGQADARLINVIASFVGSDSFSTGAIDAASEIDPNLPEVLAVTHYFGYGTQDDIWEAHDFGANPGVWPESLFDRTQEFVRRNLHETAASWRASANAAHAAGIPLVAYEGGQHMLPLGYGDWSDPAHVDFMHFNYAFQRSPQIKELYLEHYALWSAMGGRTLSLFVDIGGMSFFGYWGAKEYVTQTREEAPKWDAFVIWDELQAGVRAPSEPIGTRPELPAANIKGEALSSLSTSITVSGGDGTVDILLVGGELPPGLTLTQSTSGTVLLEGTPSVDGVFYFVLRALDADRDPDYRAYTVTIDPAGVTTNALVTFNGQDIPGTEGNNQWIGRYDPVFESTVVTDATGEIVRRYIPFSIEDGHALFNNESLEIPGTPLTIPSTSALNMYGGWSLTAEPYPDGVTPGPRDLTNFTGLRDHQWCDWSGDGAGYPSFFDAVLLWRADQFNALGGTGNYSFGDTASTALLRLDITALTPDAETEIRFVVLDGSTYYLSEAAYTSSFLGDGYFQLSGFNDSTEADKRWAVFTPTPTDYAIPEVGDLVFGAHSFTDVRAVGIAYHGRRWGWHYSFCFSRFVALGQRG